MHNISKKCRMTCWGIAVIAGCAVAIYTWIFTDRGALAGLVLCGLISYGLAHVGIWTFCSGQRAHTRIAHVESLSESRVR